jgi:hypothetical protein
LGLCGGVAALGDHPQRFVGGLHDPVPLQGRVPVADVVGGVDRVEDLDRRTSRGREPGSGVEVGKGDPLGKAGLDDVAEDLLERLGIVRQVHAVVGEVGDQQLGHERLALEHRVGQLALPRPPLHEPDHLGVVVGVSVLAGADELQVQPDAGQQPVAGVLGDQVAAVIRVAFVQHWDHVDRQARANEGDGGAVGAGLDLVGVDQLAVGLPEPLGHPVDQLRLLGRGVVLADVDGHIQVVDGPQRGALGDRASVQHLHRREPWVLVDVKLQAVSEGVDLVTVALRQLAGKVHRTGGEGDQMVVGDDRFVHSSLSMGRPPEIPARGMTARQYPGGVTQEDGRGGELGARWSWGKGAVNASYFGPALRRHVVLRHPLLHALKLRVLLLA